MKRGDIVLIKFPYSDGSSIKVRPAVIVSSDVINSSKTDLILIAISSNIANIQSNDLLINERDSEFKSTGLHKSSVIKTCKIIHVPQSIIKRRLGGLDKGLMNRLDQLLLKVLGIQVT